MHLIDSMEIKWVAWFVPYGYVIGFVVICPPLSGVLGKYCRLTIGDWGFKMCKLLN
jgi:hypothetical protein